MHNSFLEACPAQNILHIQSTLTFLNTTAKLRLLKSRGRNISDALLILLATNFIQYKSRYFTSTV